MPLELKATSTYDVTQTGVLRWSFPFEYLRKAFVRVRIKGSEKDDITELVYGEDYTIDAQEAVLKVAPQKDKQLTIYRETTTERMVSWEDASILKSRDLTLTEVQSLHLHEEELDHIELTARELKAAQELWEQMAGGQLDGIIKAILAKTIRKAVITVTSTFNVPADITRIFVSAVGAGSGGTLGTGGKPGEAIFYKPFAVTPQQALAITVGAGGSGYQGTAKSYAGTFTGTAGGETKVGTLVTLAGGAVVSVTNPATSPATGGLDGGSSMYGAGGRAGFKDSSGSLIKGDDGAGYGSGGGAGVVINGESHATAGNGANGIVVIEW